MIEKVIFRDYSPYDPTEQITALLHESYGSLARQGFRFLASHQDDEMTLKRMRGGHTYIGEFGGAIIATITVCPPEPHPGEMWYGRPGVWSFGQFAVSPQLQRNGIGTRMVALVEEHARARGAAEMALDTAEGATHLRQWYERLGYRFIEYVQWKVTNYRSVVMSKTLRGGTEWR